MKQDSLAHRVFLNTRNVVLTMGSVLIIGSMIYRYSYMQDGEYDYQAHKSQVAHTIFGNLVGSLTVDDNQEIVISTADEAYLAGYQKLRNCGQIDFWTAHNPWSKDKKYSSYNGLLHATNKVNDTLHSLYADNYLRYQYRIATHAVLESSCQHGMGKTRDALEKLSVATDVRNLNWTERQNSSFNPRDNQGSILASIPTTWHTKKNPWRGLDGCIYLAKTKEQNIPINPTNKGSKNNDDSVPLSLLMLNYGNALHTQLCQTPDMYKQAKVAFAIEKKEHAHKSIMPIRAYQEHTADSFSEFIPLLDGITTVNKDSGYFVSINGVDVPVGFNAQLTINPDMQIITKSLTQCFTGKLGMDNPICQRISQNVTSRFAQMESKALVRQVGVAIIDVPSGRIDVATGSASECFETNAQQKNCLDIPDAWKKTSINERQANPALYVSYQPGSTIKPIQALAMVRAFPNTVATENNRKHITELMARSKTEETVGILACQYLSTQYANDCQGFKHMQQAAIGMGWNNECQGDTWCGHQDILLGHELGNINMQKPLLYGKLLTDSSDTSLLAGLDTIPNSLYQRVAKDIGGATGKWYTAKTQDPLHSAIQESYGQRNARTTPLGLASAMRMLLVSADKDKVSPTHLVENLWTAGKDQVLFEARNPQNTDKDKGFFSQLFSSDDGFEDGKRIISTNISKQEARTTIGFFTQGHSFTKGPFNGTARTACLDVFGKEGCNTQILGYHIFSKTGTPGFGASSIKTRTAECQGKQSGQCVTRPMKWFVLGVGKEQDKWQKVIVVMADRNWNTAGTLDDSGDSNNVAARIAFSLMKILHEESLLASIELKDK